MARYLIIVQDTPDWPVLIPFECEPTGSETRSFESLTDLIQHLNDILSGSNLDRWMIACHDRRYLVDCWVPFLRLGPPGWVDPEIAAREEAEARRRADRAAAAVLAKKNKVRRPKVRKSDQIADMRGGLG